MSSQIRIQQPANIKLENELMHDVICQMVKIAKPVVSLILQVLTETSTFEFRFEILSQTIRDVPVTLDFFNLIIPLCNSETDISGDQIGVF